jgi:CHASE3 domain sensor protein
VASNIEEAQQHGDQQAAANMLDAETGQRGYPLDR